MYQTFKQLNTHYSRRMNTAGPPLAVQKVKVTFKDEPGEGSGVARSFYTSFAEVRNKFTLIMNIYFLIFRTSWLCFNFPFYQSLFVLYTQAILSSEKLPNLEGILVGGKNLQYSK